RIKAITAWEALKKDYSRVELNAILQVAGSDLDKQEGEAFLVKLTKSKSRVRFADKVSKFTDEIVKFEEIKAALYSSTFQGSLKNKTGQSIPVMLVNTELKDKEKNEWELAFQPIPLHLIRGLGSDLELSMVIRDDRGKEHKISQRVIVKN